MKKSYLTSSMAESMSLLSLKPRVLPAFSEALVAEALGSTVVSSRKSSGFLASRESIISLPKNASYAKDKKHQLVYLNMYFDFVWKSVNYIINTINLSGLDRPMIDFKAGIC